MSAANEFLERLLTAPEYVNPAISLAARAWQAEISGEMDFIDRAARSGELERAVEEGAREGANVAKLLQSIEHAVPRRSKTVPAGF